MNCYLQLQGSRLRWRLNPVQDIEEVWIGLGDSELTTDGGSNTEEGSKWTGRVIRQ